MKAHEMRDLSETELRARIEDETENLQNSVHLLGFMPNIITYLKAFDIFTLTSVKEGLPYTLLEAGYAELPVVATATGGIPEVITDMQSGILVRSKDSKEIEHALLYLLEHPEKRKEFGEELKSTVTKDYSVDAMLQQTLVLYTKE